MKNESYATRLERGFAGAAMTPISQGLPPLPRYPMPPHYKPQDYIYSEAHMREYGDARAANARRVALESLLAQFNQPHQEYFGDAIQDAIKELI